MLATVGLGATPAMAERRRQLETLADQMKHREKHDPLVELDLADPIEGN